MTKLNRTSRGGASHRNPSSRSAVGWRWAWDAGRSTPGRLPGQAICLIVMAIVAAIASPGLAIAQEAAVAAAVRKIAFGSCADQHKPCPIWKTIADYDPDLMILLGDNIYSDLVEGELKPATPERIAEAYQRFGSIPEFARLRKGSQLLATWDDHDYGNNDSGVEWQHKQVSAKLFHDFFETPTDSPLRSQAGVYSARVIGPPGKRVQVILLDTRYFRSPLAKADEPLPGFRARPYVPASGAGVTLLGEAQWAWLEQQLRQPAEVRLIGSSIQILSDDHPFEKWGNFPEERQRLFDLIAACEASGVVLLSGDRHLGEISLDPSIVGYPLYDITASGLNQGAQKWRAAEANRLRVAALPFGNHFGAIEIDWDAREPVISLQLRHEDGAVAVQSRVPLSVLKAPPAPLARAAGTIGPIQALRTKAGEKVSVQFAVRGGRVIGDRDKILLNSEADFRDSRNFTVVVERSTLAGDLADADLNRFLGCTIRAEGLITPYRGINQLVVESAEQLKLLEAP